MACPRLYQYAWTWHGEYYLGDVRFWAIFRADPEFRDALAEFPFEKKGHSNITYFEEESSWIATSIYFTF